MKHVTTFIAVFCVAALGAFALGGCDKNQPPATQSSQQSSQANLAEAGSQYAGGLLAKDRIAGAVNAHYHGGDLPTSNAQVGLPAPDAIMGDGTHLLRAELGPAPGVITVTWSQGVLAGKVAVFNPVLPNARDPQVCWNVDHNATTVPEWIQQLRRLPQCAI